MLNIQQFYRQGMKANGFGPVTFQLDKTDQGDLNIFLVKAAKPTPG